MNMIKFSASSLKALSNNVADIYQSNHVADIYCLIFWWFKVLYVLILRNLMRYKNCCIQDNLSRVLMMISDICKLLMFMWVGGAYIGMSFGGCSSVRVQACVFPSGSQGAIPSVFLSVAILFFETASVT